MDKTNNPVRIAKAAKTRMVLMALSSRLRMCGKRRIHGRRRQTKLMAIMPTAQAERGLVWYPMRSRITDTSDRRPVRRMVSPCIVSSPFVQNR